MRKALIGLLLGGSLVLLPFSTARSDENTGLSASKEWAGRHCGASPVQETDLLCPMK